MAKHARTPGIFCQHIFRSQWPALLIGLMLIAPPVYAQGPEVTSGHSAHWFNLERAGEGLVLEIMSPELALLYWFTYDEHGNQRWLTNVGHIDGDRIVFEELLATSGGRLGPDFDPDEVVVEVVGEAELVVTDCDNLVFSYSAFGESESIDMIRLTQTMAAGCQPIHGVPGEPVRAYAGQSGSWFDPASTGQGYTLQWMSRDQAVLVWFSYDAEGNQYWMIGNGEQVDGQIHFGMLHSARGGRFGDAFDSDAVELIDWGSLVLEIDCMEGTAHYESLLPEFGSGTLELERLSFLDSPDCPWEQPRLSDLYDISWVEIPIAEGERISAVSISDNGVIAGINRSDTGGTGVPFNLALWRPEGDQWEMIPGEINGRLWISADGLSVLSEMQEGISWTRPVIWNEESGWKVLPGLVLQHSSVLAVSSDFSRFVGLGRNPSENWFQPWIWDAEGGQRILPTTEDTRGSAPMAVSNDGSLVVGDMYGAIFWNGHPGLGLAWIEESEPVGLLNDQGDLVGAAQLCNHDCSVTAGYGLPSSYTPGENAWFRTSSGLFGYLGTVEGARPFIDTYIPTGMSADGSVIVGFYRVPDENFGISRRGFIWTQHTGMVSVPALVEEIGVGDDDWARMSAARVSRDGRRILLTGDFSGTEVQTWDNSRAVVLELNDKE